MTITEYEDIEKYGIDLKYLPSWGGVDEYQGFFWARVFVAGGSGVLEAAFAGPFPDSGEPVGQAFPRERTRVRDGAARVCARHGFQAGVGA